jgi:uncharacterized protein YdeI (YjbR/CyaY-like superfamily)
MNNPQWNELTEQLKSIIAKTELVHTIKWGGDIYTIDNKNIVGVAAFKSHVALWFFNGAFLEDPCNVLINASEGKTKALRQWRFTAKDKVNEKRIIEYLRAAIANEKKGVKLKPEKKSTPELPEILSSALNKHRLLKAFNALTPFKQREFIEHIVAAKRVSTQQERVEKAIPLIAEGIGLNDKYRKLL